MTMKIDLLDIDQGIASDAICGGKYEVWNCPEELLDRADAIEGRVCEHDADSGGIVEGCWKPSIRRITTLTGLVPKDWYKMWIRLKIHDVELDLRDSFGKAICELRDMAQQLEDIADTLSSLNPVKSESEVDDE